MERPPLQVAHQERRVSVPLAVQTRLSCDCSRSLSLASVGDMWYTEISLGERGVEYRYMVVQTLHTGEKAGLRVTRRETFIKPRRLSLSQCTDSSTEGECDRPLATV